MKRLPLLRVGVQAFAQAVGWQLEGLGQRGYGVGTIGEQLRVGPDGRHGGADGQRLTVAVRDHAAACRDLALAQEALLAFIAQKFVLQHLAMEGGRDDGQERRSDHQAEHGTPGREARRLALRQLRPAQAGFHALSAAAAFKEHRHSPPGPRFPRPSPHRPPA
jgi:hypothetical protein